MAVYRDRADAGRRLAAGLGHLADQDLAVLGLPRGGVPVAFEVARALEAPLDVIVVRKLGARLHPELAMGAIGEDGVRVLNEDLVRQAGAGKELEEVEARERVALEELARRLRGSAPMVPLEGRTAVVVDDGIATGSTATAACQVARARGAGRIVLATPVGAPRSIEALRSVADEVVCPETPEWFVAVGSWYEDFSQVSDAQVVFLLEEARRGRQP